MDGLDFDAAVLSAQASGFAEADPSEDLSGRDAGRKLQILARLAFDREVDSLDIQSLDAAAVLAAKHSLRDGESLRMIGRARLHDGVVVGQIRLERLARDDGFAGIGEEWNRLAITLADGSEVAVTGRGAGRWPTTEAMIADLLELSRR